jgi:hypothetical protein
MIKEQMKDTDKVYKVRVMQIEEEFTLRVPEGVKIDGKILKNDFYLEEYENRDVVISYAEVDAFLDPSTFYNTLLTLDTEMGIEPDTVA